MGGGGVGGGDAAGGGVGERVRLRVGAEGVGDVGARLALGADVRDVTYLLAGAAEEVLEDAASGGGDHTHHAGCR